MEKVKRTSAPETIAVIIIMAFILMLRLYHIDAAPLEIEESWRQGDTESIARNFAEYRFDILYPNFNYDGPLPNVPALEFQITTFIIAALYKTLGYNYIWARLVPICFFMCSALLLYLFTKKYLGKRGAALTLAVYGTLPINIYYSRAIMPEAAGLTFFIGGLYFFDRWFTCRRLHYLALSSLFTALAVMTKPVTVFVGIPMLYICFRETGWKWLSSPELWLYAVLTLGLPVLYYKFSISVADMKFALGLTRDVLAKRLPGAVLDYQSYVFIASNTLRMLTPTGTLLALVGLFSFKKGRMVIPVWFVAMAAETLLVVSVIRIYYYLIFFAVPCSILIGKAIDLLYEDRHMRKASVFALCLLIISGLLIAKPSYRINTYMQTQISIAEQLTEKDDLLVSGSIDPCLLSISGRKGWRFNIGSSSYETPYEELDSYIKKGAKYFIPIKGSIYKDDTGKILEYLNGNYQKIEVVEGYPIYKLQ